MRRHGFSPKRWAGALALVLAATSATAAEEIRGEEFFSNRPLITQDGETVRFWDDLLKDKIVVINFIYTDCPNICSVGTARLAQVYDWLGERMGRDVFFYSITIDPENDTPEDLKIYADSFGIGKGWEFLTGTREDIDAIRFKLGERAESLTEHRSDFVIGNAATGIWRRSSAMGSLAVTLQSILELDPDWSPPAQQSVASANPDFGAPTDLGEAMFLTACASCHTIGGGVRFAPDLAAVTLRRDRDWLQRYLINPDGMLRSGDPTAVALNADYPGVRMPTIGLGEGDVETLIAYLEAKDRDLIAAEDAYAKAAAGAETDHDHASHDHGNHEDHSGHSHDNHGHSEHDH